MKKLLEIMAALREPETGCPWDIEQNFKSIAAYTVEEAYEVADAIERGDMHDLRNELGDLLFQVVFHAQMASEQNVFSFPDVVEAISDKLVRRHPHVFGDDSTRDKHQLMEAWEQHKKNERDEKSASITTQEPDSLLAHVASTLPALRWSEKLQKKAASAGFDWDELPPVYAKLEEELDELKHEARDEDGIKDNHERIAEEMGDLLFSCVNLSRHLGVNPEQALRDANRKFISRFSVVEQLAQKDSKALDDCSIEQLEAYWQKAKDRLSAYRYAAPRE